jgi:hypothetical protein
MEDNRVCQHLHRRISRQILISHNKAHLVLSLLCYRTDSLQPRYYLQNVSPVIQEVMAVKVHPQQDNRLIPADVQQMVRGV